MARSSVSIAHRQDDVHPVIDIPVSEYAWLLLTSRVFDGSRSEESGGHFGMSMHDNARARVWNRARKKDQPTLLLSPDAQVAISKHALKHYLVLTNLRSSFFFVLFFLLLLLHHPVISFFLYIPPSLDKRAITIIDDGDNNFTRDGRHCWCSRDSTWRPSFCRDRPWPWPGRRRLHHLDRHWH